MKRTIAYILIMIALILSGPALTLAGAGAGEAARGEYIDLWQFVASAQTGAGEAAPQKAAPNIMIPDPLFTFDDVVDGTTVVHDFRVYNRGQGALAISKVQTG